MAGLGFNECGRLRDGVFPTLSRVLLGHVDAVDRPAQIPLPAPREHTDSTVTFNEWQVVDRHVSSLLWSWRKRSAGSRSPSESPSINSVSAPLRSPERRPMRTSGIESTFSPRRARSAPRGSSQIGRTAGANWLEYCRVVADETQDDTSGASCRDESKFATHPRELMPSMQRCASDA